jgi:hypothetical protein
VSVSTTVLSLMLVLPPMVSVTVAMLADSVSVVRTVVGGFVFVFVLVITIVDPGLVTVTVGSD